MTPNAVPLLPSSGREPKLPPVLIPLEPFLSETVTRHSSVKMHTDIRFGTAIRLFTVLPAPAGVILSVFFRYKKGDLCDPPGFSAADVKPSAAVSS